MNQLDELRKKKMELFKQNCTSEMQSQLDEELQLQQQVAQFESNLKFMMTPDAVQRYANVKLAHPEKALQTLVIIAQMLQSGDVRIIDDAQLKSVLLHLTQNKKQTGFKFHGAI